MTGVAGSLPGGAVKIGAVTFEVLYAGANVQIFQQIAVQNSSGAIANVGLYVVLDGQTDGLQDGYNKAIHPGIPSREEATTTIFGMAAGGHTIELYAMTDAAGCNMQFCGIFPLIFYA